MNEIIVKGMVIQGTIGAKGNKIDIRISGLCENYKNSQIIIDGKDLTTEIRKVTIIAEAGNLPRIEFEMYLLSEDKKDG